MFSERLERLIQAALQDGMLTDQEKAAIIKRAQAEGEDIDEVDIYIQSLQQQRQQELKEKAQKAETEEIVAQKKAREAREKEELAHEKLRKGNVCPHCGEQIPPLTKICPNCGKAVNANETEADKELAELIDKMSNAIKKVKTADTSYSFKSAKADCESLMKKAEMFYGDNRKIQMLVFDLKNEIKTAESAFRKKTLVDNTTAFFQGVGSITKGTTVGIGSLLKYLGTNKWFWCVVPIVGGLIILLIDLFFIPDTYENIGKNYGLQIVGTFSIMGGIIGLSIIALKRK